MPLSGQVKSQIKGCMAGAGREEEMLGGASLGTTPTVFREFVGKRKRGEKKTEGKQTTFFHHHKTTGVFTKCW